MEDQVQQHPKSQPIIQSAPPVVPQSTKLKWIVILIVLAVLIICAILGGKYYLGQKMLRSITDFDSCGKAGNPVTASYPATCHTSDGRIFVQQLSTEEQKKLIPQPTDQIADWDSYYDSDLGVNFKHPKGWRLFRQKNIISSSPQASEGSGGIFIEKIDNPNNLSLDSYLKPILVIADYKYSSIMVDGLTGYEFLDLPGRTNYDDIYIKKGDKIYRINSQIGVGDGLVEKSLLKKIVETIKFTN